MFLLCGLFMRFFKQKILSATGEDKTQKYRLIIYDELAQSRAGLYSGLFVDRSDVVPQGADGDIKPQSYHVLLVVGGHKLAEHLHL